MNRIRQTAILATIGAVLAGWSVSSPAQIAKKGDGYLMRIKYTPGAHLKYSAQATFSTNAPNGNASPTTLNMPFSMLVKSFKNGVATIEFSITPPSIGSGTPKPQTSTVQLDTLGRPVGGSAAPGVGTIGMPETPVKIGQTWTSKMPGMGGIMPGANVTATYKLVGFKNVGGRNLAIVAVTMNLSGGESGMRASGNGTLQLRTEDGSLHAADIKQSMTMTGRSGGSSIQASTNIKVVRLQ